MKVVHLLGWYFPESLGGTEVYVAELARRQRAAVDVRIAAPLAGTIQTRIYRWNETTVFRYPVPAVPSREEAQGATAVRGHADFVTWLRNERADIVHVHTLATGVGLHEIDAARRLGARVVFTAHLPALGFLCQRGTMLLWGRELCDGVVEPRRCAACVLQSRGVPTSIARTMATATFPFAKLAARMPGRIGTGLAMPAFIAANYRRQRYLLGSIDRFVVLNRRAHEIVTANGAPPAKLVINRLGIGFAAVAKPSPDVTVTNLPLRIGFIGRIHETKGVRVFARAVSSLPRHLPIAVEIAGPAGTDREDSTMAELRAYASRDSRIVLRSAISRNEIPAALRRFDVLCCPSVWFENGPTIAIEAQSVGTPVIGTDVGAMPEFIRDRVNGRVLPAGDWRRLRDALAELVENPHIIDCWRRALPPPRSMDDVTREYVDLYKDLCQSRTEALLPCGA